MRPHLRMKGNDIPKTEVFITCCGEDPDVILDTIRAACHLDYPRDKYRIVVLDDGMSAELEAQVGRLRKEIACDHLFYTARGIKVSAHYKAEKLKYDKQYSP